MIIKRLHIDSFGIFKDHEVDGLKQGINVICGNNESGKTTLGEFIKRTLFKHYDRRSSHNTYAIDGASPGGSLSCTDSNGREFTISRSGTRNGGTVTVTRDGESGGAELLKELLPLSEYFYRNIYAITIEELHSADFMNNEELRSRLFSAGLETGTVSLTQLRKELNAEMDVLFKKAGEKNRMYQIAERANELKTAIDEAEELISSADEIRVALDHKGNSADLVGSELNAARLELVQLEHKKRAYEAWVQLQMMQVKLKGLPDAAAFPVDGLTRLVELKSSVKHSTELHEKHKLQYEKAVSLLKSIVPNEALLNESEDIISLYRDVQSRGEMERRRDKLIADIKAVHVEFDQAVRSLGDTWDEAALTGFKGGKVLREQVRELGERIAGFEREQETARAVASASQGGSADYSRFIKWLAGLLVIIAGGVVMIWSLIAGIIVIIAVMLYALITAGGKKKTAESPGPGDSVDGKLADAREKLAQLLENSGLSCDLNSASALVFLDEIEICAGKLRLLNQMRQEKEQLETAINNFDEKYKKLCDRLNRDISSDTAVGIELLYEEIDRAREDKLKQQSARENLTQAQADLEASEKQLQAAKQELAELLNRAGVEDEVEFRKLAEALAEREAVTGRIADLEASIRSQCADGEFDSFIAQLKDFSPDSAAIAEQEINERIVIAEKELEEHNRKIGTLQEQLRTIENNRQLEKDRTELESCLKQLHQLSREWTRLRLALHLLDDAIAKYERERRPGVIDAAAKYFRELTGGAYVDILQKLEDNTIVVNGSDGKVRQVDELSRGTREELLLCLRLGVVSEFEKSSVSLPLILDDVLVDFDNPRRETAVKMLADFAVDRQLIIMSCHRETVELYQNAGANIIQF